MHLSDLLDNAHLVTDNPAIHGVSCDSRQIKEGYVFVAIKGTSDDGNQFINDAIRNGAVAIITDQDITTPSVPMVKLMTAASRLPALLTGCTANPIC